MATDDPSRSWILNFIDPPFIIYIIAHFAENVKGIVYKTSVIPTKVGILKIVTKFTSSQNNS